MRPFVLSVPIIFGLTLHCIEQMPQALVVQAAFWKLRARSESKRPQHSDASPDAGAETTGAAWDGTAPLKKSFDARIELPWHDRCLEV
jgi:hypothetical protein